MPRKSHLRPTFGLNQMPPFLPDGRIEYLRTAELVCGITGIVLYLAGGFHRPLMKLYRQRWKVALPMIACSVAQAAIRVRRESLE